MSVKKRNTRKKEQMLKLMPKYLEMPIDCIVSPEPTCWLIILNASYDSLVTGEQLCSVMADSELIGVQMFLGERPFSYAQFKTCEGANRVFNLLDGQFSEELDRFLFLAFAKQVPDFPPDPLQSHLDSVPGLSYHRNFLSFEQELLILDTIQSCGAWEELKFRKVQHFGHVFDYGTKKVTKRGPPMPNFCSFLMEKKEWPSSLGFPDQLTINWYRPGDGIAPHIDTHSAFLSPVVIISLGHAIVMEFSHSTERVEIYLERGSMLVLEGDSRFIWEHAIKARKIDLVGGKIVERRDRWSLTFRNVRRDLPCECDGTMCD
jgi:alkylated DNA repair protein alkB family protein 8